MYTKERVESSTSEERLKRFGICARIYSNEAAEKGETEKRRTTHTNATQQRGESIQLCQRLTCDKHMYIKLPVSVAKVYAAIHYWLKIALRCFQRSIS